MSKKSNNEHVVNAGICWDPTQIGTGTDKGVTGHVVDAGISWDSTGIGTGMSLVTMLLLVNICWEAGSAFAPMLVNL